MYIFNLIQIFNSHWFLTECTTLFLANPNLFKLRCPEQLNFRTKSELYFWIVVDTKFLVCFGNDIGRAIFAKHQRKCVNCLGLQWLNMSFLHQIDYIPNCSLITSIIFIENRKHVLLLLLLQLNLVMIRCYFYCN